MGKTHKFEKSVRAFVIVACLAMAASPAVFSQSQQGTGQIVGTVYDQTGAAVPGAKVSATGKATGLLREVETNEDGGYRIVLLPPGPYTISVVASGFKNYKTEVTVNVGSAITVDPKLQVGAVSEVVEVTATQIIETTAVQSDALINQRSITDLPINGRRFQDFVTLTPTVQIEPSRSGISFAGQRGINSNVTIDGADYNQPFFGGIRGGERSNQAFTIPQESIAEFQIVPYGYSAEFGRSTAGVLNAVTKSGTNEWHASAFYFFRGDDTAKKDAFNRKALDSQHQVGGSIGLPVRQDKSFLFFAGELQQVNNPREVIFRNLETTTLPGGRTNANGEAFDFYGSVEGPFTQTNDAWTTLVRWDEQLNSNHRVNARYHYSTNTALNAVATGNQINPETNLALSNNGTEGDNQHTIAGQWTGILSPRLINELRAQYSREKRPRLSNSQMATVGTTVGTFGTRNFLPTTQKDYRVQISDNITWNVGRHSVKLGGEFNHLYADQFFKFSQFGEFSVSQSNVDTALRIMSIDPTLTGTSADRRFDDSVLGTAQNSGTTVSYLVNIGNGLADMTMRELAFYAQDAFRITPRFTLTAGFRWEGYWNPESDVSNTALYNTVRSFAFPIGINLDPANIPDTLDQFMPRLGIAWDPWGNGRTVFRANAGLYYARNPLLLFAGPVNNYRTPAGDLRVRLPLSVPGTTCPAAPAGFPGTAPSNWCRTVYGQFFLAGVDLNNSSLDDLPALTMADIQTIATALALPFDPNQGVQPIAIANNYKSPRSWQWNVAMEHELARGWSVGGDFVYINTVHLQRNRDLNMPTPIIHPGGTATGGTGPTGNGTIQVTYTADASGHPCFGLGGSSICTPGNVTVPVPQGGGVNANVTATSPFTTRSRPISSLGQVQQREASARALYRGFTFRTAFRRSKYQLQAYYTLSANYSDDDNERDAGGFGYEDGYNLINDYGYSNLDARHLFVFNGVHELPWGFTVSSLGRFRSARPMDPLAGSFTYSVPVLVTPPTAAGVAPFNTTANITVATDTNGSLGGSDRPLCSPTEPCRRNWARDRANYSLDMRVTKRFNLPREGMFVQLTADFFNLFNFDNITHFSSSTTNRTYGPGFNPVTGALVAPNAAFRQLRVASACLSPTNPRGNKSCYDTNNTPGAPLQVQFGVRFQF
jgi:outer membrane receptor for ferrienterochelin and colicin